MSLFDWTRRCHYCGTPWWRHFRNHAFEEEETPGIADLYWEDYVDSDEDLVDEDFEDEDEDEYEFDDEPEEEPRTRRK